MYTVRWTSTAVRLPYSKSRVGRRFSDGKNLRAAVCKRFLEDGRGLKAGNWGGECTHAIHDRSRSTTDPRISTMPGRSTSGSTDQAEALLAPSAKHREVLGESHEG